jgi:nucleoside-diphosphate-sugar epimerase
MKGYEAHPAGVTLYPGNMRDRRLLSDLCAGLDAIIHTVDHPSGQSAAHTAIVKTRTLLEAARQHAVPRVVTISSTVVYALPALLPLTEAALPGGTGLFGQTCLAIEHVCEQYRAQGQHMTILRSQPCIASDRSGAVQILFDRVRHGRRIPVIGAGNNRYQVLAIADLTEAALLALTSPSANSNDTFNIGAKRFGMVRQDLRALCDYAGNGARVLPTPAGPMKVMLRLLAMLRLAPLPSQCSLIGDWDVFVSTAKLEHALGWQPRYSNAEALIHAYQGYLDRGNTRSGSGSLAHRAMIAPGLLRVIRRIRA